MVAGAVVALAAVPFAAVPWSVAQSDGSDAVEHRSVFRFADERIDESSGLVAGEGLMFTVNDSGDDPVVYAVSPRTGETVDELTYSSEEVTDVEALAPGAGALWVGDIGDNGRRRLFVEVFKVELPAGVGAGTSTRSPDALTAPFRLAYPDGPHDAETLLVHPRTGRLYVVTKGLFGGSVYAAPRTLDASAVNPLVEVGEVSGLLTDGAFFPDGRHLILRGYGDATVYTFPRLEEVAGFPLPDQEQGEAVAVDRQEQVFISTEGANTEVLEVLLPRVVRAALAGGPAATPPAPSAAPTGSTASPAPTPAAAAPTDTADDPARPHGWRGADGVVAWIGAAVLVGAFVLRLYLRASRRRSRRRR